MSVLTVYACFILPQLNEWSRMCPVMVLAVSSNSVSPVVGLMVQIILRKVTWDRVCICDGSERFDSLNSELNVLVMLVIVLVRFRESFGSSSASLSLSLSGSDRFARALALRPATLRRLERIMVEHEGSSFWVGTSDRLVHWWRQTLEV